MNGFFSGMNFDVGQDVDLLREAGYHGYDAQLFHFPARSTRMSKKLRATLLQKAKGYWG